MASRINASMGSERRREPRAAQTITFSLQHDHGPIQAETKNLSASGAYCTVDQFIPPMTKVQVSFDLPAGRGARQITCTGVIVRMEPITDASMERWRYYMAIWFSDLSERDRSAIGHYVQQRLAASS